METRFDKIANSYEKAIGLYPYARNDAEEILRLLELNGNERVLEITSGSGYLSLKIARILKEGGGFLISQDIAKAMMNLAEKKADKESLKNIRFYLTSDMSYSLLEDSSIDKAVCLGGFHHIEEPIKVFWSIKRILKPGGIFAAGDFADDSPVQKYFDERIDVLTDNGHQGLFLSESHMENFARFSGMKTLLIERKKVPFIFSSRADIGIFYQLVHALNQEPSETEKDVECYMGIEHIDGKFIVPMDYIFAKYQKV